MSSPIIVPKAHYKRITAEYATTPVTFEEIGDRYGVTREAIRKIVKAVDHDAANKHRQAVSTARSKREDEKAWDKLTEYCAQALAEDRHCAVCDGWVIRLTKTTCSPECTEIWNVLRTFDRNELHRKQVARYILKSESADRVAKDWANAVLSDSPPPRNRRYIRPGSKRSRIIATHRPEAYRELIGE